MSEVHKVVKLLGPINATPQEIHTWLVGKYSQISHSYWLNNGQRLYLMGVGDLIIDEKPHRIEILGRQVPDKSANGEINNFPVFAFELRPAGKDRIEIAAKIMIDNPDIVETCEFLIGMLRISYPELGLNEITHAKDKLNQYSDYHPGRPSKEGYDAAFDQMEKDGLSIVEVFSWWRENFPDEYEQFEDYPSAMMSFRQSMKRRRLKKTQNS